MALCCFDNQLNVAAGKLGIPVWPQDSGGTKINQKVRVGDALRKLGSDQ